MSDENENNTKSGATGRGICSLCWTDVQSPLCVQLLFLIADYKTLFDLSFPRHYTDIVQIPLFLLQAFPFWESLRNTQQVCRLRSYLTLTQCSKVHAFMIPVILPSGYGLGVCNKAIILWKTGNMVFIIADISSTVSWYMLFFQVLFLWNFSRLWKYIRNSCYSSPRIPPAPASTQTGLEQATLPSCALSPPSKNAPWGPQAFSHWDLTGRPPLR